MTFIIRNHWLTKYIKYKINVSFYYSLQSTKFVYYNHKPFVEERKISSVYDLTYLFLSTLFHSSHWKKSYFLFSNSCNYFWSKMFILSWIRKITRKVQKIINFYSLPRNSTITINCSKVLNKTKIKSV